MVSDFAAEGLEKPILHAPRMPKGMRTKYVPNRRSFGVFIKSDQVRDPTVEAAQDIALAAADNVAPRTAKEIRNSRGLHDRVRKGFRVKKKAGLIKVAGNLRVKVEVYNNADGAALIEFGGRGLRRQRPLAKAGAEFGDFKPEGGPT